MKAAVSLLRAQSLSQNPASRLQEPEIRLVIEDERAALVRARGDLHGTKLKAGISPEMGLLDFGIGRMIGILCAVTEMSGETERQGRVVVGPRLAMTGNVIGMTGVTGPADAAAPDRKLEIESATGLTAAIDANETVIVNVIGTAIGTAIGSETETATVTEKEIGTGIVTVIELIEIVKGIATVTVIETEIGTVTTSLIAGMIDILVAIWIAVASESRHENGLQKGTEIVAETKTKTETDHEIGMIARGQDLATVALLLVQTGLVHAIVEIDQVLALLLAEDHALQTNWTLIGMSQSPATAADPLVVGCALLNEKETGKETDHVIKNGTENLVVTDTSLGLLQETEIQKGINQEIGIVTGTKTAIIVMIKMVLEIMIETATTTVTAIETLIRIERETKIESATDLELVM